MPLPISRQPVRKRLIGCLAAWFPLRRARADHGAGCQPAKNRQISNLPHDLKPIRNRNYAVSVRSVGWDRANRRLGGTSVGDWPGLRSPTNLPRPCPTLHSPSATETTQDGVAIRPTGITISTAPVERLRQGPTCRNVLGLSDRFAGRYGLSSGLAWLRRCAKEPCPGHGRLDLVAERLHTDDLLRWRSMASRERRPISAKVVPSRSSPPVSPRPHRQSLRVRPASPRDTSQSIRRMAGARPDSRPAARRPWRRRSCRDGRCPPCRRPC